MATKIHRSPVTGTIIGHIDLKAAEARGKKKSARWKKTSSQFVSREASKTVWKRAGL